MITLWQDFRYAARVLRRAPAFTAVAAIVLASGIGANSAIFSLFDAVVLRPLPFQHPEDLAKLWENPPGYAYNSVAPLNFLDWSEQNTVFASMAAVSGGSRTLHTAEGGAERIPGQSVSLSFFDLLGIRPVAGRMPSKSKKESETDWPGIRSAPPSAVCSVRDPPETAAMDANTVFCSLQSRKLSGATLLYA